MSTPAYLTDGAHLLLTGVTGYRTDYGGKTAWATWWADNWGRSAFDVVIFGNYKGDNQPEDWADVTVPTVDGVARAIEQGDTVICLTPESGDWAAVHGRLLDLVRYLPDDMEKAVIHDEAPALDQEVLLTFVRVAGNGSNCKSILLSQSPGDIPMSVRKQCILGWIGPVTGDEIHVFRANEREQHYDEIAKAHEPYTWSFMTGPDPADRDTFAPVPARYA